MKVSQICDRTTCSDAELQREALEKVLREKKESFLDKKEMEWFSFLDFFLFLICMNYSVNNLLPIESLFLGYMLIFDC